MVREFRGDLCLVLSVCPVVLDVLSDMGVQLSCHVEFNTPWNAEVSNYVASLTCDRNSSFCSPWYYSTLVSIEYYSVSIL